MCSVSFVIYDRKSGEELDSFTTDFFSLIDNVWFFYSLGISFRSEDSIVTISSVNYELYM